MMGTISTAGGRVKRYAAGLAMAALLGAVLTLSYGTGQAQGPGDPPPVCGPGKSDDNYPDNPLKEVRTGHYAIFDAYWLPAAGLGDDARDGTLNNNLCPPAAKHADVTVDGETVERTTLSRTSIDLRSTIIHVDDSHKAFVVEEEGDAGTTKLSLEKYEGVDRALGLEDDDPLPDGTQVYWLRLEDPDRGLPPSSLVMGFSAGHFDDTYWAHQDEDGTELSKHAFQYELEAVRYHGPHASKLPQVLTYWEPELGSGIVWNSLDTDVNSMPLEAGQYEHLEWVFTHPGTYVLEVHLKGHVRQVKPDGAGADWAPITDKDTTVTSEVREYTIQVGDLHVNAQPHFGYNRAVSYQAPAGTHVGAPIPVFGLDRDNLTFSLAGAGSKNFKVVPATMSFVGKAVQVVVSENSNLNLSMRPAQFDLWLQVKDGRDVEDNADDLIDDVAAVRITVQSPDPWASLKFLNENPRVGDQVKVVAQVHGSYRGVYEYELYTVRSDGTFNVLQTVQTSQSSHEFTITRAAGGLVTYGVEVRGEGFYDSALYRIVWRR